MKLAESLSEWTEWTRQHVLSKPSLPLINRREIDRVHEVVELWDEPPEETRQLLETFLGQHYDDLAARYVVLSLLWELLNLDYGTYKEFVAEQRSGYRESLTYFVGLVDLDHLTDPKIIAWEIVNACSVAEWDLGLKLYGRLKDSAGLSESHFRALKGQFLYLSADWEPYSTSTWPEEEEEEQSLSCWSPELPGDTLNSLACGMHP